MIRKRIKIGDKTKVFLTTCDACGKLLDKAGHSTKEQALEAMLINGWKLLGTKVECGACGEGKKPAFITERKPPEGSKCHGCGKEEGLKIVSMLLTGPFSGHMECSLCGYKESTMSYVGRNMVRVEPLSLPSGGLQI